MIGVSGVAVPIELRWGRDVLARFGSGLAWGSGAHYAASGVWVTIALLPFCTAMGATFPLAMAALQDTSPARRARSFSYLYLANVIGATTGTLASALFLVELFGFQGTLILSALLNAALAIAAFLLGRGSPPTDPGRGAAPGIEPGPRWQRSRPGRPVAPLHDGTAQHGDGGRVGASVHPLPRDGRLYVRGNPRPVPCRNVPRFDGLQTIGGIGGAGGLPPDEGGTLGPRGALRAPPASSGRSTRNPRSESHAGHPREFFEVARSRLAPDGILQHWFPGGEPIVLSSIAKALTETFPYVRVFNSHEGWGYHFLASVRPIPAASAVTLAGRLPARAAADMIEWEPGTTPVDHFAAILARELPMGGLITPGAPALSDDRPLNEYYLLRTLSGRRR